MFHAIGSALFLGGLWLLLSGYFIGLMLSLGVASVVVVVAIAHRMDIMDHEGFPIHLGPSALTYFPWLFKEIIVSNIAVAKAILGPIRIQPQVLTAEATQDDELGRVLYANSITLTPGTVSIGVDGNKIEVHALLDETAAGIRDGGMDRRIARMTNRAMPPSAAGSAS